VAWDVNGRFVAAATQAALFVSDDGGTTFRTLGGVKPEGVRRVLVRADGVLVAQSEETEPKTPVATWVAA
jgi:hypothetical protein